MKKITILSLSALFLAACSSTDYDNEVSTETYQETYTTDEVPQPITKSNIPLEEDLQSNKATESSMVEPNQTVLQPKSGKKVIKLSPSKGEENKVNAPEATVLYSGKNSLTQPEAGHYLIQVAALQSEKFLYDTAQGLPKNQPKWQNVKTINNQQWHSLLLGNFKTAEEAKDAIMRLPASYQAMGPFVKSVDSITQSPYPMLKKLP